MKTKEAYIYIMASKRNGTLYVGVTSNLKQRVWNHKNSLIEGFTKKYDIQRLVYYEKHSKIRYAINKEKQIKKWNRDWKLRLVETVNPNWDDLYDQII